MTPVVIICQHFTVACKTNAREEKGTLDTLTLCIFTALSAISSPPIFSFYTSTVTNAVWKQKWQQGVWVGARASAIQAATSPLGCCAGRGQLQTDISCIEIDF